MKSIASPGKFLPAEENVSTIDFGCSAPQSMRLRAGCWLRGASGTYTGRKIKRGTRSFIVGGRSQAGEDLFLVRRLFSSTKGAGTFLEMGGLDGLKYSNSYYFEKVLGWTGVMIEGSPNLYAKLVKNRPGVVAINAMVCSEAKELHWIDSSNVGGSDAVGGAWELMPETFRKEKHGHLTPADIAKFPTVPCVSLSSALARFGVRHVDLFSLDVEGAEASVIKTLDFTKFTASVVVFEDRPGSSGVREQLLKAGYVDYGWVNPNHIFLHPRFKATLPPKL